jgi:drug/metabolite transporter (DMT)-like permease
LEVNKKDFIKLAFLGIFGSVLANIFLTKSLGPLGPGFFSFLQAFQPLFVVWLATTFLKEDFDGLYPLWGMWVIGSSVLLNITDFELGSFYKLLDYPLETLLALIAMMIWGSCTVIGKNLLKSYSPSVVVFWRWAFATVTLGVHMTILGHEIQWGQLADFSVLWRVLCISTVMGCFAMVVYYNGLKRFPASLTAFIELSYPAFTMLVGSAYLYHKIEILQLIGLVSLTGAIFFMVKGSTIFEKKKTRS